MSPLDYYLRNLPFRMPVFDRIFAGSMILGLFDLGFGYVEVGSVTPEPQVRYSRLSPSFAALLLN